MAVFRRSLFLALVGFTALSGCGKKEDNAAVENGDQSELAAEPALIAGEKSFESWQKFDDAKADGWESEVFNDQASGVLKKLDKALQEVSSVQTLGIFGEGSFVARTPETDPSVSTIQVAGGYVIQRWKMQTGSGVKSEGAEAVIATLREIFYPPGHRGARTKFKIVSVEQGEGGHVSTGLRVEAFAKLAKEAVEQVSHWRIDWVVPEADQENPLILSITVLDTEKTTRPHSDRLFFSDCTRTALEADPGYRTQVLRGLPYWLERQNRRRATDVYGFPGISVGDVNGDGLEDLFVCESQGVPHCLYVQNPDGTLSNRAAEWGVDWLDDARSALLVDLDNDGDEDLVVAAIGFVLVSSNEGGRFELKATLPCSEDVTHLSAADYDLDGRVDLYVSAYLKSQIEKPTPFHNPGYYIDSEGGAGNDLFRNESLNGVSWKFTNVTEETGLDAENRGQTLSTAWEDFDGDGDLDLYVANDFGSNPFYRNDIASDGKRFFTNIADGSGVKDTAFGMSATWGDYNRDGAMDLYVANMWSSAGKRVTSQEEFKPEIDDGQRSFYRHFARGNTLLKNLDGDGFEDVSEDAGVVMGRWAWSSPFVDINNDGWEDMVVANGYITGTGPGDL